MHREYTSHVTEGKDPQDFLQHVCTKYTDFPLVFAQNVRLFLCFHVFVFTSEITVTDLFAGRYVRHSMFALHIHAVKPTYRTDSRWKSGPTNHPSAVAHASTHNGGTVPLRVPRPPGACVGCVGRVTCVCGRVYQCK